MFLDSSSSLVENIIHLIVEINSPLLVACWFNISIKLIDFSGLFLFLLSTILVQFYEFVFELFTSIVCISILTHNRVYLIKNYWALDPFLLVFLFYLFPNLFDIAFAWDAQLWGLQ